MLIARIEMFLTKHFNNNFVLFMSILLFGLSLSFPTFFLQVLLVLSLYSLIFTSALVLIKTIMETSIKV